MSLKFWIKISYISFLTLTDKQKREYDKQKGYLNAGLNSPLKPVALRTIMAWQILVRIHFLCFYIFRFALGFKECMTDLYDLDVTTGIEITFTVKWEANGYVVREQNN